VFWPCGKIAVTQLQTEGTARTGKSETYGFQPAQNTGTTHANIFEATPKRRPTQKHLTRSLHRLRRKLTASGRPRALHRRQHLLPQSTERQPSGLRRLPFQFTFSTAFWWKRAVCDWRRGARPAGADGDRRPTPKPEALLLPLGRT